MTSNPAPRWPEGRPPSTCADFFACLEASGILSADAARNVVDTRLREPQVASPEQLATELLRAGKLTKLQARAVLAGKVKYLTFGDYVILEKLGQGGMGKVFKAEHRRMKRMVALKVLSHSALKHADAVRRFEREVQAAARLIHPHIVTAFDASEKNGVHYFVMEYVAGRDLNALLADCGRLPLETAVNYVLQAARGLAYAHRQGVVHRDIKPGNLLVDQQGTIKVLDLGLARLHLQASENGELTDTGQIMGTIDYMAPEQAEDTRSADARADIYSLGCTLYRLVSGDVLYAGDTVISKLLAHRTAPIPALPMQPSGLDTQPRLDAFFHTLVAKRPEDRPSTMDDVVTSLEAWLQDHRASASSAALLEPTANFEATQRNRETSRNHAETALAVVKRPANHASSPANENTTSLSATDTSPSLPTVNIAAEAAHVRTTTRERNRGKQRWLVGIACGLLACTILATGVAMYLTQGPVAQDRQPLEKAPPPPVNQPTAVAAPAEPTLAEKMAKFPPPEVDGDWQLQDGALIVPVTKPTRMFYLRFGDPAWVDYDLEARVTFHKKWPAELGLLARVDGDKRWQYIVGGFADMRNRDLLPFTTADDAWNSAARRFMRNQVRVEPGGMHTLRLRVRGNTATTFFDGEQVATSEVDQLSQGRAGICMFGNSLFREIEVRSPQGEILWRGLPDVSRPTPTAPK